MFETADVVASKRSPATRQVRVQALFGFASGGVWETTKQGQMQQSEREAMHVAHCSDEGMCVAVNNHPASTARFCAVVGQATKRSVASSSVRSLLSRLTNATLFCGNLEQTRMRSCICDNVLADWYVLCKSEVYM